jgi:hypothetical protein
MRYVVAIGLLTLSSLTMQPGVVAGQTPVRLEGRVIERGSEAGIVGATVTLNGVTVATDITGRFVFAGVTVGARLLRVEAFGYATHEQSVAVGADTTLLVELDPAPLTLDPLLVEGRTVTVRGEVYEQGTDIGLFGIQITADPEREEFTNVVGHFKLGDMPAGPPFRLSVLAFGYMPINAILSVFEDTTLVFELEPDPVMQRMIAVQVARLEERSRPHLAAIMPPMDREYLMANRNATALDLIRYRYGQRINRVGCILIDDRQSYNGLDELNHYLPDELERIEMLYRGAMLRIYTRDYLSKLVGGGVKLVKPLYVQGLSKTPFCR